MKKCSCCGKEKPLSEFYFLRKTGNYHSYCKDCCKKQAKVWKKNNPDKVSKSSHNYFEKNRDKLREKSRKQYQKDLNHSRQVERSRYHKDIEKSKEKQRTKYHKNIENSRRKEIEKTHKRRARETSAEGFFNKNDIEHLLKAQNHKCLMCGKEFNAQRKPTVDHIVPISKKGRNDITNLQLLCKSCNSSKGAKAIDLRGKSVIAKIFEQFSLF